MHIITEYGSMGNFISLYRKQELLEPDLRLAQKMIKKVLDINFHPNSKNYDKLVYAIIERNSQNLELYSSKKIDEVLESLRKREKDIIIERYGLISGEPKKLEEIGEYYGVSRERIRQIEKKALKKLRHPKRTEVIFFGHLKNSNFIFESEMQKIDALEDCIYNSNILFEPNEEIDENKYKTKIQIDINKSKFLEGVAFIIKLKEEIERRKKFQEQMKQQKEMEIIHSIRKCRSWRI